MEFIEVNRDNWIECARLSDKTDIYIHRNVFSIAEAQFYLNFISLAIVTDNKIIGYTMVGECEDDPGVFFIYRFMIGINYRRKGYGQEAIKKIIQYGYENGCKRIETSMNPKNKLMEKLITKCGFKTDGELVKDEVLYYFQEE